MRNSVSDFEKAKGCYKDAIVSCLQVPLDNEWSCLETQTQQLNRLYPQYNLRKHDEDLYRQYAPERCKSMYSPDLKLPKDKFLLQCRFTALTTQVTTAHLMSLWDELSNQD